MRVKQLIGKQGRRPLQGPGSYTAKTQCFPKELLRRKGYYVALSFGYMLQFLGFRAHSEEPALRSRVWGLTLCRAHSKTSAVTEGNVAPPEISTKLLENTIIPRPHVLQDFLHRQYRLKSVVPRLGQPPCSNRQQKRQ